MTSSASAGTGWRSRTNALRSPGRPRYRGWSFGRRGRVGSEATTGTCRSSARRTRSVEQRARRTPAPARMTGSLGGGEEMQDGPDVATAGARGAPRRPPTGWLREARGRGRPRAGRSARDRAGPRPWPGRRPRGSPRRSPGRRFARPLGEAADGVTRSTSWKASRPRTARSTWPTRRTSGDESAVAVWIPMARLAAPTALVPRHAAGRPVSCP